MASPYYTQNILRMWYNSYTHCWTLGTVENASSGSLNNTPIIHLFVPRLALSKRILILVLKGFQNFMCLYIFPVWHTKVFYGFLFLIGYQKECTRFTWTVFFWEYITRVFERLSVVFNKSNTCTLMGWYEEKALI